MGPDKRLDRQLFVNSSRHADNVAGGLLFQLLKGLGFACIQGVDTDRSGT